MAAEKKKMAFCLIAVLLFVLALFFRPNNSNAENSIINPSTAKPLTIKDVNKDNTFKSVPTSDLWRRMVLAVVVVVLLGIGTVYLSKKFLPKLSGGGKEIQIIETVHLGHRKSVHLIKVGSHKILVGSTNENISKLADLTDFHELLDEKSE